MFASRSICWIFIIVGLSGCASTSQMQPFSSDGCSLFPDRSIMSASDWCHCCLQHDLAYWRGGTKLDRLKADNDFHVCVLETTGNELLANMMHNGVRAGGSAYFPTPFRWAYGWQDGRRYQALTADEQATADELQEQYLNENTSAACPSKPPK